MKTIIITGNDTGVGKTKVAGYLAKILALEGLSVRYVKLVETGIGDEEFGDIESIIHAADRFRVQGVRLFRYQAPLATVTAAQLEGTVFIDCRYAYPP